MHEPNITPYLNRPIFLHAVNRELHDALGKTVDAQHILHSIRLFSVLSGQTLFCNVSQVYEVFADHPEILSELTELTKLERLIVHSDYGSLIEFLESRRQIFAHSKDKHPVFFDNPSRMLLELPHSYMGEDAATTNHIEDQIKGWIDESKTSSLSASLSPTDKKVLRKSETWLNNTIRNRDQQALTFDLFEQTAPGVYDRRDEGAIRRALTQCYIDNYIKTFQATCIWGYHRINHFERFMLFTGLNLKFANFIMLSTGLHDYLRSKPDYGLFQRQVNEHSEATGFLRKQYAELAESLDTNSNFNANWSERNAQVTAIIQKLKQSGLLHSQAQDRSFQDLLLYAGEALSLAKRKIETAHTENSTTGIAKCLQNPEVPKESYEPTDNCRLHDNEKNKFGISSFVRSHNFLVIISGCVSFFISLISLEALNFQVQMNLALSLISGIVVSCVAYWFHRDFYYRRMVFYGLAISAIGGWDYTVEFSGFDILSPLRFELVNGASIGLLIFGAVFATICLILDFKHQKCIHTNANK